VNDMSLIFGNKWLLSKSHI